MKNTVIKISILLIMLFKTLSADMNSVSSEAFEDEFMQTETLFDPLSGYNKAMTEFNDGFYVNVLTPITQTYTNVVHDNIRTGVSNVFKNLMFPVRFINNILQLKLAYATEELGRFALNSTYGLLGIIDVGKRANLEAHPEDFGQTLGFYGVESGFHVVIPFLGPSNLRDIFGLGTDYFINPFSMSVVYEPYQIPDTLLEELGYISLGLVNEQSFHPNQYLNLKKEAVDLYPFMRDIYEQRRKKLIEE